MVFLKANFISEFEGGGISTIVTSAELLDVIGGNLTDGRFIENALSDIPVTVLGNVTAQNTLTVTGTASASPTESDVFSVRNLGISGGSEYSIKQDRSIDDSLQVGGTKL